MKKRFLAMLLALVMCLALVPTAALAADSDFVIEDGVLTVYNGKDVNVVIPDGITSIGRGAFKFRTQVVSVTIPNSVTSIETSAFLGCSNLTSVAIPDSVAEISSSAFEDCSSLPSIILPNRVRSIRTQTFSGCTSLASVTIPNSVTSIESNAFSGCTSLTNITIPSSVTSVDTSVFQHCTGLTSVSIPDSLTYIGSFMFSGCTSLTNVSIPNGVTSIRNDAFNGCTGLTSVTIPSSVTYIGYEAFNGCTALKDVYFAGTQAQWETFSSSAGGNAPLTSAAIHYNATAPEVPATPEEPAIPDVPEMAVPDLGDASIQESVIQKGSEAADWVERVKLPEYAEKLYDTISGSEEKGSVFEEEKNFILPQASTGPAVSKVDKIEAAEFSLLDLYANPGAELDSAIFSNESFYDVPANAEDQKIDFTKLAIGDLVTTANYNGVYVTKIPYDSAFDTKKTEACEYIAAVYHAFDRDHPEAFWLSGKCKARVVVAADPATKVKQAYFFLVLADKDGFTMRAPAWTAEGSIAAGVARRDAAVAGILKTVTASSAVDQIKQLNKWLTEHNQYNTTENLTSISNEPHECLAALEGKIGTDGPVCDGYARAFKVLCDKLGIPCVLETGWARATAGGPAEFHMWNLVQAGDAWYGADITWDDPSVKGFTGAKSGRENEDYLLVGADTVIHGLTFSQSHVVKNQAAVGGVDFNNGPVMGTQAYASQPALPATAPAAPTNDKLSVDGKEAAPAAYKINNANYFKLRDVAMLVNGTKAQFSIDYSDGNIYIVTGQPYRPIGGELNTVPSSAATAMTSNDAVYINGVETGFAAYKIGGANYYGIRALGKALGFNVGWKSGVGMYIETDKPYTDAD